MALTVKIKNFKSIGSIELNLKQGLNVVIGPNGSGKTCILSSLKFISDLFTTGVAEAMAKSGGSKRVYRRGKRELYFSIECDYGERTLNREKLPCKFLWNASISQTGPEKIGKIVSENVEIVASRGKQTKKLFSLYINRRKDNYKSRSYICAPKDFGRDLFSYWDEEKSKTAKPRLYTELKKRVSGIKSSMRRLGNQSCFPQLSSLDHKFERAYFSLVNLNEYNILPEVARQATEQMPFSRMRPDGEGVSEVIHALVNKQFHRIEEIQEYEMEFFYGYKNIYHRRFYHPRYYRFRYRKRFEREEIYNALSNIEKELAAAVHQITSVNVQIDPTSGKRFVTFKSGNNVFFPEEVSDGTIKWLCILVSLFVPYSSIYILEEPENFLHPWMQQRLIQIMRDQANKNGTIFLLTSHSSTILNSTKPEEVLLVSTSRNGTKLKEVEDKKEINRVLVESDFRLGDLWVSGIIGGTPENE